MISIHSALGRSIFLFAVLLVTFIIHACVTIDRTEEVVMKGTRFELEVNSKKTLETTERYRKIILTYSGSDDQKTFVSGGSEELSFFPVNSELLTGIEYTLIDTVRRTLDNVSPSEKPHTLYVDPDRFTKEEYNALVEFVRDNYTKPFDQNVLVKWLNTGVAGLEAGDVYFNIYAIVYQRLSALEPKYASATGKEWVRIQVNNSLRIHSVAKDGLDTESDFGYTLKQDTLFYPDYESHATVDTLLTYKQTNGTTLRSRVNVLMPVKVN